MSDKEKSVLFVGERCLAEDSVVPRLKKYFKVFSVHVASDASEGLDFIEDSGADLKAVVVQKNAVSGSRSELSAIVRRSDRGVIGEDLALKLRELSLETGLSEEFYLYSSSASSSPKLPTLYVEGGAKHFSLNKPSEPS